MTARQATASGYCKAAALAWLLYDIALTMDLEVTYIWRRKWTTFTTLFAVVRYVPLLVVGSSAATNFLPGVGPAVCDVLQWIEAGGTFVILVVVQIILQFRLYVMYGKSRKVLISNLVLCAVELACAIALVVLVFPKTVSLPNSPAVFGSCFSHSPREIAVVLLAPLAYETYLALLALNKTWQTNRSRHALGKRTSLMGLLVRDNIVYFFLVAATLIWVTVVWFMYPASPGNSLISFTHVSGSIGGTRLILNVRRTALKPHSASVDDSSFNAPMELPVVRPRHHHRRRSFHATVGPSFGNLNIDLDDHYNNDNADIVDLYEDDDDDDGLISPVDYGRDHRRRGRMPFVHDSGVHLPESQSEFFSAPTRSAQSGRQNGMGKVFDEVRRAPTQ